MTFSEPTRRQLPDEEVVLYNELICEFAEATLPPKLEVHPDFKRAICRMPTDYDQEAYMTILHSYGTVS